MSIRYLSVFSGIEAFSVAVRDLDFDPVAFAEIDKFPSKVLSYHYPSVPNLGDVTKIDTANLGRVDWLVGGCPCQSFSVAGLRRGLSDDRGNLTLEYVRLAHELATNNGLRGLLFENVPGILSSADNAFGCFLGGLVGNDDPLEPGPRPRAGRSNDFWRWIKPREREPVYDDEGEATGEFTIATEGYHRIKWPNVGMVAGPRARLAWRILDSRHFGVPQRRRRVYLVADFGNGADPAAVLFEPQGVYRDTPPSREARQDVAAFSASSIGSYRKAEVSGADRAAGGDNGGGSENLVAYAPEIARCVATREGSSQDYETTTMVAVPFDQYNASIGEHISQTMEKGDGHARVPSILCVTGEITHTLKAEGADASEDGTGRGQPIVAHAFDARQRDVIQYGDITGPLDTDGHTVGVAIAFTAKDYGADAQVECAPTLRAGGYTDSHANGGVMPAIAFQSSQSGVRIDDVHATLDSNNGSRRHNGAVIGSAVRRLTPVECERLQGFPDGYTLIPGLSGWRDLGDDEDAEELRAQGLTVNVSKSGKRRVNDPDGPRYKSLGNSFTTEPINWIMSRAQASLRGEPMPDWQPMRLWTRGPWRPK